MRQFYTKSGNIATLISVTDLDEDLVIGTDKETHCSSIMGKAYEIIDKTKLVVVNNHTLAVIHPESEMKSYEILHTSVLKGATFEVHPEPKSIGRLDTIRLASEKDFDDFRCHFGGFRNTDEYLFKS